MRAINFIAAFCALFIALPAAAQPSSIVLNADPVPVIDARINDRPVRLEVDLRMGGFLVLSQTAAERLRVQRVPFLAVAVGVEGGTDRIRGRAARPRLVFPGGDSRAFTGIFAVPVSSRADGVVGPGALPYDIITVNLGSTPSGAMRDITFRVEDADNWVSRAELAGAEMRVGFSLDRDGNTFSRSAVALLDPIGQIRADGALREMPVGLGLRTMMQPVLTELAVQGLPLAPAFARTNAPLLGALDEDTIVVTGRGEESSVPGVTIGRTTLSRCTTMTLVRRTKTLTLRCAA